jgi:uncharacterized protein (TIGR02452 family)
MKETKKRRKKIKMSFNEKIECWNDTQKLSNSTISYPSTKYVYDEKFTYDKRDESRRNLKAIIKIMDVDTLDIGQALVTLKKYRPLILNFADDNFPGGAVNIGSGAQEECIFRRTNYHKTLKIDQFYPLKNNECVYSPNVLLLKTSEKHQFKILSEPILINLIACPGIRLHDPVKKYNEIDENIFLNKIRLIFQCAYKNKHDSLILGALSCGAWKGPPKHIAELFKKVIEEYNGMFKIIIFAILKNTSSYVIKNHDIEKKCNYEIFKEVFTPLPI